MTNHLLMYENIDLDNSLFAGFGEFEFESGSLKCIS